MLKNPFGDRSLTFLVSHLQKVSEELGVSLVRAGLRFLSAVFHMYPQIQLHL